MLGETLGKINEMMSDDTPVIFPWKLQNIDFRQIKCTLMADLN